jgi:hypothetical protein
MNNKMLTIAALAAVLVAGIFATTPMAAFADGDDGDYSGTETSQEIKQKNSGGDGSTNVNCASNDIGGAEEEESTFLELQLCGTAAANIE